MSINAYQEIDRLPAVNFARADAFVITQQARAMQALYLRKGTIALGRAVARASRALRMRVQNYVERRQALAHLSQLDDRLLADIGLSRGNLLGQLVEAETGRATRENAKSPIVNAPVRMSPAANANGTVRAA